MPTIVDTLAVELSLDPKKLEQGLSSVVEKVRKTRDDYERHAKAFEAVAAGLLRVLTPLAAAILGITSAIEAIDWSKQASAATTEFSNLANVIGMNIEQLSAWRQAAEAAGKGGGDALVQSFAHQQQTMLSMMKGGTGLKDPNFLAAWHRYGMGNVEDYLDEKGNLDMDKFNKDLAAASQKLDRTAAERNLWLSRLYITNPAQQSLYANRAQLEEELRKQKEKVGVISKDNADAAKKLQADWANLEASAENLKLQIMSGLVDPLSRGLEFLQKILKDLKDWTAPDWFRWMFGSSPPPDWLMKNQAFRALSDSLGLTVPESRGGPPSEPITGTPKVEGQGNLREWQLPQLYGTPGRLFPGYGTASPTPPSAAPASPAAPSRPSSTAPPATAPSAPGSLAPSAPVSGASTPNFERAGGGTGLRLPPMPTLPMTPSPHSFLDNGLLSLPQTAAMFSQSNSFASNRPSVNTNSNVTIGAMSFHATTNDSMLGYAPSGNERTLAVGEYSVHANTSLI